MSSMAFIDTLPPHLAKRLHLPLCRALAETGVLCATFRDLQTRYPSLVIPVATIQTMIDSLVDDGVEEITADHLGHMVEILLQQRLFDVVFEEAA